VVFGLKNSMYSHSGWFYAPISVGSPRSVVLFVREKLEKNMDNPMFGWLIYGFTAAKSMVSPRKMM